MSKYFLVSNEKQESEPMYLDSFEKELKQFKQELSAEQNWLLGKLRPSPGRIIVSIDKEGKNSHQLTPDIQIQLARNVENLNRRETMPVNAVVVYSDKMERGTEVLVHHNSFDPNNELFDIFPLSGTYEASNVKYFSIKEEQCFLYRDGDEWLPCHNFATALRLFKPVDTIFEGVLPDLVTGQLLVTSGEYAGKCCLVVASSDYEVVYQGIDGKEKRVIRIRHFEGEENEREEIIAVDMGNTKLYNEGKLLAGLTDKDAKPKS